MDTVAPKNRSTKNTLKIHRKSNTTDLDNILFVKIKKKKLNRPTLNKINMKKLFTLLTQFT